MTKRIDAVAISVGLQQQSTCENYDAKFITDYNGKRCIKFEFLLTVLCYVRLPEVVEIAVAVVVVL